MVIQTLNDLATLLEQRTKINANFAELNSTKYAKPQTGVPSTDLDAATQTSLGKANSALQPGDASADLPTVTLTGTAYNLNAVDHANRLLICTSDTSVTLTIQTDAAGGFSETDSVNAYQAGAGQVTIVYANTVMGRAPAGTLSSTYSQYRFVGAIRVGVNQWTQTEIGGASISGLEQMLINPFALMVPEMPTTSNWHYIGVRSNNTIAIDTSNIGGCNSPAGSISAPTNFKRNLYTAVASAVNRGAGFYNNSVYLNANEENFHTGRFPITLAGNIGDTSPTLGAAFIGIASSPNLSLVAEPSAITGAVIGICCDSTDANWQLIYGNTTGGATKVNMGADFARAQDRMISVHIEKSSGKYFVVTVRDIYSRKTFVQGFTLTSVTNVLHPSFWRCSMGSAFQAIMGSGGFICGKVA